MCSLQSQEMTAASYLEGGPRDRRGEQECIFVRITYGRAWSSSGGVVICYLEKLKN